MKFGARRSKVQELEEIVVFIPLCRQLTECSKALWSISSGCEGFVSGQKTGTFALTSLLAVEETNIEQAVSRRRKMRQGAAGSRAEKGMERVGWNCILDRRSG